MQYQTAKKCKDNKTCDECEKEFAFIEKGCVSYDIIPNNKFVDSCDEYNSNYLCIRCKDDCSLKGKKCKCSHELKIVICFGFLIALSLLITIFFVKLQKKKKNEISTESNKMLIAVQTTK